MTDERPRLNVLIKVGFLVKENNKVDMNKRCERLLNWHFKEKAPVESGLVTPNNKDKIGGFNIGSSFLSKLKSYPVWAVFKTTYF